MKTRCRKRSSDAWEMRTPGGVTCGGGKVFEVDDGVVAAEGPKVEHFGGAQPRLMRRVLGREKKR